MSTYIVGDLQGCLSPLQQLLEKVNFNPKHDTLWAVGDLVARGEQSLETLSFLYGLGNAFKSVLGNHDLHLIAIALGEKKAKPSDKLDALLISPLLDKYCHWLRHMPLAVKPAKGWFLSHAGLYPAWTPKQAVKLATEVSNQLTSANWQSVIKQMYGNHPTLWQSDLKGMERTRFIINALTRMRYVDKSLNLDFACKTAPEQASASLSPWYEHSVTKSTLVFGHWAALLGQVKRANIYALDTGYVWGNKLTMLQIENKQIFHVSA